jgi:hypothetical protein
MATSTAPVFVTPAQGRVVHRLTVPAPLPAPPGGASSGVPINGVGPARSPFWQNRLDALDTERRQLAELKALKSGVTSIDTTIGGLSLPASFSVTTQMSAADTALVQRGVVAAEQLATNTKPRPDSCASRGDMSDQAYTVVARLTTLAASLMDRKGVTLNTVLAKLTGTAMRTLVADVTTLLAGTPSASALTLLGRAVDPAPFSLWSQQGVSQTDPRVYAELNRRAALLLAAKCEVATTATGTAIDWPPPPVAAPPTSAPVPSISAAPTAKKARSRKARP